jgi:hypothetical protein
MRALYELPASLKNQNGDDAAKAWVTSLAAAIIGLTTDTKLIYQAWINVTRSHKGRTWPVPGIICGAIVDLAPDLEGPTVKRSSRPDGKNSRDMGDYVRANHQRVINEWWQYSGDSIDALVYELGANERQAAEIRHSVGIVIERAAHYHVQKLYWGTLNSPLDLDHKDFDYWKNQYETTIQMLRSRAERRWPSDRRDISGLPPASGEYAKLASKLMGHHAEPEAESAPLP